MKQDLKNVLVSFALVLLVSAGSSVIYQQSAAAEELNQQKYDEYTSQELMAQEVFEVLLLQKSLEEKERNLLATTPAPVPTPPIQQATVSAVKPKVAIIPATQTPSNTNAAAQAAAEAKATAAAQAAQKAKDAALLAQQIADAKAAAKKQAAAANQVAAKTSSRQSRAS